MRSRFLLFIAFFLGSLHLQAEVAVLLRSGDAFDMRIGGIPQEEAAVFALKYTIGQEGTIHVPLVGEIRAIGLTPSQLERAVEAKLVGGRIFTHPTVLIEVAQGTRYVSISGGVRNPQRIPWTSDLTLSSGIGDCGGPGDFFRDSGIRLIRDGKIAGKYFLKEIQKDPSKDPKLLPGDQVIVPE